MVTADGNAVDSVTNAQAVRVGRSVIHHNIVAAFRVG